MSNFSDSKPPLSTNSLAQLGPNSEFLQENGWVSIPEFFNPDFAEKLYQAIQAQTAWEMATLVDGKAFIASLAQFNRLPAEQKNGFIQKAIRYAADNDFQYVYDFIRLIGHEAKVEHGLENFVDYWGSEANIKFLAELGKTPEIDGIDAQLTRYAAGHFLKHHDDTGQYSNKTRQFAYVLNMTPEWRADFGGIFHLQDEEWRIVHSLVPAFNTLVMFKVPVNHHVSQVANYCTKCRYGVTGWLSA